MPDNDAYETLAGLILFHAQHVPEVGECFNIDDMQLTVKEMKGPKIERVEIKRPERQPAGADGRTGKPCPRAMPPGWRELMRAHRFLALSGHELIQGHSKVIVCGTCAFIPECCYRESRRTQTWMPDKNVRT